MDIVSVNQISVQKLTESSSEDWCVCRTLSAVFMPPGSVHRAGICGEGVSEGERKWRFTLQVTNLSVLVCILFHKTLGKPSVAVHPGSEQDQAS